MEVIEKKSLLNSIELIQDAFLESRKAAKQALLQQGLPTSKSEEYKFTPITRQLENTFTSLQASKKPSSVNIDEFLVPELDAHVLVFVNGQLDTRYSRINSSDFILKDLSDAKQEDNKEVETHFSKYAASEADPFVALNTSTWNHGVFIHVKENVIVQKPLIIHSIADANNGNIILAARNLILLEKNAHISVIEKYDSVGDSTFSTGVNEVIVKENANFTYKLIQNDAGNRVQVNHTTIHQEKNCLKP
jgi:Fe-S cluster assembly protein SufD